MNFISSISRYLFLTESYSSISIQTPCIVVIIIHCYMIKNFFDHKDYLSISCDIHSAWWPVQLMAISPSVFPGQPVSSISFKAEINPGIVPTHKRLAAQLVEARIYRRFTVNKKTLIRFTTFVISNKIAYQLGTFMEQSLPTGTLVSGTWTPHTFSHTYSLSLKGLRNWQHIFSGCAPEHWSCWARAYGTAASRQAVEMIDSTER